MDSNNSHKLLERPSDPARGWNWTQNLGLPNHLYYHWANQSPLWYKTCLTHLDLNIFSWRHLPSEHWILHEHHSLQRHHQCPWRMHPRRIFAERPHPDGIVKVYPSHQYFYEHFFVPFDLIKTNWTEVWLALIERMSLYQSIGVT